LALARSEDGFPIGLLVISDHEPQAISLPSASSASLRFITLPSTVKRILLHLDLPHRPPRVSPARGPPQAELHFDQTPAFDLAAPEAIPEYEFDQSAPHDWEA